MGKITPEQFCSWLQGFIEIQDPEKLDTRQTQIIKDHLAEVFDKVTPQRTSLQHFCNTPKESEQLKESEKKIDEKIVISKRKKIKSVLDGISNMRRSSGSSGPLLVC